MMLQRAIQQVAERRDLSRDEAFQVMESIMKGEATEAQIGALMIAMRMKGETADEIAGFASSMRQNALPVSGEYSSVAVDLVGTGGDGRHTFNISTVSALVVAGAGVPVAKHGNRSVSSKCGSADVLIALGVNIELDNHQLAQSLDETGIAFLFAPKLHVAMKHAVGARRDIGVRSFFNILGPITNPAGVKRQLIGVYHPALLRLLAEVLLQLNAEHIMLVHSADGLDEISLAGPTHVAELRDGRIREFDVTPSDFGLSVSAESVGGGEAAENAEIALSVLGGAKGAARDIVVANAAAGLLVAGAAATLAEGARLAAESVDSGAARSKLDALAAFSQQFGEA